MNSVTEDILMHYGIKRRSGRYPYGSGKDPYQHGRDFLVRVNEMKKSGFEFDGEDGKHYTGEKAIAAYFGLTTSQLRTQMSLATNERRSEDVAAAQALRDHGYSNVEIGRRMGINESSVRSLLNESSKARMNAAMNTAEFLKSRVDEVGMVQVGAGAELEASNAIGINVSKERMKEAIYILELEGYEVYGGGVPNVTNKGRQTNIKVICPPGTEHKEIYNYDQINSLQEYVSHDGGETFDKKWVYPESMSSKRIEIRYGDQKGPDGVTGSERDGLIEIRPGVKDLDLGESRYAQCRILVDGTHYVKGMAVYNPDLPEGVDLRFNTNKKTGTPICGEDKNNTVLKKIKSDPENPFGSLIKEGINDPDVGDNFKGGQSYYYDSDGKKKLSLINKRAEEGDWGEWADKLPSQFLSKQTIQLAKHQLAITAADKDNEFKEIMSLEQPTVKKALLEDFADGCDSAAVHLKAAALPRQKYQVIIPVASMKSDEVYAPNYQDGETLALIRYPHGGTFEIPIVRVNNKQKEAVSMLGKTPKDAIGINSKVAEQLSGADFDGDTVMAIPCNSSTSHIRIASKHPLKELEGFDPKVQYGGKPEGTFKKMKDTQKQMGVISNLISDMTLKGAPEEELARAVKHSMVVIDAEKHNLDYKQSERDNGIAALKRKWQGHIDEDGRYREGASTLISKAKSETTILKRQGSPKIDPETGDLVYKTSDKLNYTVAKVDARSKETPNATIRTSDKGKQYIQFDGEDTWIPMDGKKEYQDGSRVSASKKEKQRTQASTKMADAKDARDLISDANTPMEQLYADYANHMKQLARNARLEVLRTGKVAYDPQAKKTYAKEVESLQAQLRLAQANAPRERQAQVIANATIQAKQRDNPGMTKAEVKKESQRALAQARAKVGAKRTTVKISDREWEAIMKGAVSENILSQIIKNSDKDVLRSLATPRANRELSTAKQAKIQSMKASGNYSIAEIAQAVGVSASTVNKYI